MELPSEKKFPQNQETVKIRVLEFDKEFGKSFSRNILSSILEIDRKKTFMR